MNHEDMRGLFNEALDGADPVPDSDTDHIVKAGRRLVRRRRAAIGSGATAGVAVLASALVIPVLLAGGPDSVIAALPGLGDEEERSVPDSCDAADDLSDEQRAVATMYDASLESAVAAIGGTVAGACGEFDPDYDHFYFDEEADGYRYQEYVIFRDAGEHARLLVEVLEPNDTAASVRMESLADCDSPGVDCAWDSEPNEEGMPLLLVEETRTVNAGAEDDHDGEQVPVRAALIERPDGVIVRVELEEALRSGGLSVTPGQLAEVALAIPVGDMAPDVEQESTGNYTLPADADLAQALLDGISEQFPGATVPPVSEVEFTRQEQTEAYAEGYHYGNDNTRIAYADATVNGEQVRFFLQVTQLESPGDGGASQEPAEHYASCANFDCEYSQLDESTGLVHRTSVDIRPGPTSIEHRAADGWVVGVGAESLGSTEAPSIDFEALDTIVHSIR